MKRNNPSSRNWFEIVGAASVVLFAGALTAFAQQDSTGYTPWTACTADPYACYGTGLPNHEFPTNGMGAASGPQEYMGAGAGSNMVAVGTPMCFNGQHAIPVSTKVDPSGMGCPATVGSGGQEVCQSNASASLIQDGLMTHHACPFSAYQPKYPNGGLGIGNGIAMQPRQWSQSELKAQQAALKTASGFCNLKKEYVNWVPTSVGGLPGFQGYTCGNSNAITSTFKLVTCPDGKTQSPIVGGAAVCPADGNGSCGATAFQAIRGLNGGPLCMLKAS